MNAEISQIHRSDVQSFRQLVQVFAGVFEMKNFDTPSDDHLRQLLSKESFFAFVARSADEIVGGITCYVLDQYYATAPLAYVFDLAVVPRFQRLGLGRQLMKAVIEYSRSLGIEEVFVQADDVDLHALEFYHATGGIPEKVTHFGYPLGK